LVKKEEFCPELRLKTENKTFLTHSLKREMDEKEGFCRASTERFSGNRKKMTFFFS